MHMRGEPDPTLEFSGGGRSARTETKMGKAEHVQTGRTQTDRAQTDQTMTRERSGNAQTDKPARIDFQTEPARYRHWKLKVDGEIATLVMDVDEKGSLFEGYDLKLNSYDLGVDIELADAIERLRFEHPGVRVLVLRSAKPRVFSAGANNRRPARSWPPPKADFCKAHN